ncbi:hypothetical protein FHX64_001531 [Microbacter margulisiae]|uniref:Uncharacterized protein n=1 Tax=Microbacter margulisiae TaxID=1350067 RepID=A0A7W5H199_9PORP|nr:hypothetical protein [Microbacter margulisiae]
MKNYTSLVVSFLELLPLEGRKGNNNVRLVENSPPQFPLRIIYAVQRRTTRW